MLTCTRWPPAGGVAARAVRVHGPDHGETLLGARHSALGVGRGGGGAELVGRGEGGWGGVKGACDAAGGV